jgi:hypothetical protein
MTEKPRVPAFDSDKEAKRDESTKTYNMVSY